jgi:hypothetical protein
MRCCPDRETVGSPAAVPPRSLGPDRAGQQPAGDQGRGQDAGTRPDRSAGDGEAGERAGDTTGQDAEVPTSEPAVPPPAAQPMGDAQVHAIVVHTLDRLGRTVRDTLNLIHELAERGVGVRNLADPIRVDSSNPDDPMAQLSVVLLALFGQMERTYTLERAAHARAVATAKGRGGPAGHRRPGPAGVRRAPARRWAHHSRDRRQDRHCPHQPVPAPATPTGRTGHRRRVRDCSVIGTPG